MRRAHLLLIAPSVALTAAVLPTTNSTGSSNATDTQPRRMANFLLAGTQKAGTTATAQYLFRHGGVCGPQARPGLSYTGKEAHFFDETDQMAKGMEHYQSLFDHCHTGKSTSILMDATPSYMLYAKAIHQYYSEAGALDTLKIMFTLREPVARDMSWYNHLLRETSKKHPPAWSKQVRDENTGAVLSFAEYAARILVPSIAARTEAARGLYAHWLQPWFTLFDRQQIYIAFYDDLTHNETDFVDRLHAFLDLPRDKKPQHQTRATIPRSNAKKARIAKPIPCSVQEQLASVYEPYNQELYQLLEKNPGPAMERIPFPKFQFQCKQDHAANVTKKTQQH